MRTEATDKLSYVIKQIPDPKKMLSFYEEQVELRDKYLKRIRERRRKERAQAKKLHPVDAAMIISKGMNEGEKRVKEATTPGLSAKSSKAPKQGSRCMRDCIKGLITIKTKHVNSIKNLQSEREEAVLTHLKQIQQNWDAWVFTETWRSEPHEIIDFDGEAEIEEESAHKVQGGDSNVDQSKGCDIKITIETGAEDKQQVRESARCARHCFFACGGKQKARGVAIVINARHAKHAEMEAVNENICAVNLKMNGQRTCIIAVYMPHAGRCSEEQENVYTELSRLIKQSKREKRLIVLAGDFNAVVGKTCDTDCENTSKQTLSQACCKFGYGIRNQKGQRLHTLCIHEKLSIGNTFFDKPCNKLWTHRSVKTGGMECLRQIDYIII